jgi:tetratricopeptide (TPR) repeat protein
MLHHFLFQARDAIGRPVQDRIEAESLEQARCSLESRGYRYIEFLTDEGKTEIDRVVRDPSGAPLDPNRWSAEEEVAALKRKGIGAHLWWVSKQHLPFFMLLAWWNYSSWTGERPFGWGDWLGFALTPLYAIYFFKLSLPFMIFQKIMEAAVWCNWVELRRFIGWARFMRKFMITGIPESELDFREAEALAALGDLTAALDKVERWRNAPAMPQHLFHTRIATVYESAGDYERMVACIEKGADMTPAGVNQWIEVATAKIRRLRDVKGAKAALEKVGDAELAALPAAFMAFARGVIAIEESDNSGAVAFLTDALEKLKTFAGNPLIQLVEAEAKGYLVIAEARLGRRAEARARFDEVRALLRINRPNDLYPRCEASLAR